MACIKIIDLRIADSNRFQDSELSLDDLTEREMAAVRGAETYAVSWSGSLEPGQSLTVSNFVSVSLNNISGNLTSYAAVTVS